MYRLGRRAFILLNPKSIRGWVPYQSLDTQLGAGLEPYFHRWNFGGNMRIHKGHQYAQTADVRQFNRLIRHLLDRFEKIEERKYRKAMQLFKE